MRRFPKAVATALTFAATLIGAGCTNTEIVYRDRQPFNTAPDLASGLLGYYSVNAKQTTCGNCHAGHQRDWATSHHSNAFADLVGSGHMAPACQGCHTVSEKGNGLPNPAGWSVKQDSAYYDVQCESCHGPGTEHVKLTEDRTKWPLARLTLTIANKSCAACHTGTHNPFDQEWAASGHGSIVSAAANNTTSDCRNCHEGKTILKAWGVNTNYVERDSTVLSATTCAVCHNPHGSENSAQLRFPINTPNPDQNLCMKCHYRRGAPTPTSVSPHGVQGFVVLGTGGYWPVGANVDTLIALTTHASVANPRLCAGCHVNRYDVVDAASGGITFQSTGHLFRPVPCLDAQGKPTATNTCAYSPPARSFKSCVSAQCHATEAVAAGRLAGAKADIAFLADQIWVDTDHDQSIDAAPVDAGYLAIIKRDRPNELSTTNNLMTPAKGAQFNVSTFGEDRNGHGDKSHGVHNPFLARALLAANITELRAAYGLPAPPATVQALVTKAIEDARLRQPNFFRTRGAMK
ncbi:MAG TPA: cytochrome c3 family protein [Gemmatimonadales bacterium]|nr:cytochrome c3 family protein [Gemmatimonadales bacterium]